MSENGRNTSKDIKSLAARIHVNEAIIKNWLRTNQMRISANGMLSDDQYQAVLSHFGNGGTVNPGTTNSENRLYQDSALVSSITQEGQSEQLQANNSHKRRQWSQPSSVLGHKERTVLNPNIASQNDMTVINPSARRAMRVQDPGATVINRAVRLSEKYQVGDFIGNKYRVISSLDNISGEANLYLCEYDGTNYMAKVYHRNEPIKDEVWKTLQDVSSPYVVKAVERFFADGQTVEILPYYKRGSLASSRLTANQIVNVVFCVNEGLKALHSAGIIHKDIKPSNLMWADNGEDVLIIDFGISSLLDENRTIIQTSTGLTLQYAAPETLHNIFSNYSDYYALGVTVYELFSGATPYSNMTQEQIEKYYSIQNFPTPEGAPQRLKDLILGTTYFDIRNRKDTDNPNCRWSYSQVDQWCKGETPTVPGQGLGSSFGAIQDYSFQGEKIRKKSDLAYQLCINWEEGKDEFLSGRLARYFDQLDSTTGSDIHELMLLSGNTDIVYMKALHAVDHGTFAFLWKGRFYQDIKEFAYKTQTAINARDRQQRTYLEEAMLQHAISEHVRMVYPQRLEISDSIRKIEDYFANQDIQRKERDVYCYVMLYRLLGKYKLIIGEQEFESVQGLTNYILQLRLSSPIDFEQFCHELISYDNGLSPQFEAWLIALGKQGTVREWQNNIKLAKE